MKNRELIKLLLDYNPDADVSLNDNEDITIAYISNDGEYDKDNTPQLFIEGCDLCPSCIHEYLNGDDRWCSFYDEKCTEVEDCYQYEEFTELY